MKTPSWFDPRAGFVGSLVMGSLVAAINASHGLQAAATSAGKQAIYTFFFGGLIMQFCAQLAGRPGSRGPVLAKAILVPSVVTIVLIFFVHSLRGTPEPILSTAAVGCIAVPSFVLWARKVRAATESEEVVPNVDGEPDAGIPG